MLPKSYLKFIAAYTVHESNLSQYAKVQTLRFIENEASESQLKIFINEGKIRNVSDGEIMSEAVPFIVGVAIVAAAMALGKIAYQKVIMNAVKECASLKGDDKKRCVRDYKTKANYAKLTALKKEMIKCNQTNNVKKCRNTFLKHMRRIEQKIQKDRVT